MATANLNDMAILATDPTFGNRVMEAVELFITTVLSSETITAATIPQHVARKSFGALVLGNPTNYKPLFVQAVAANQIVANEATATGTLAGLTPTQVATQALLCLDADINNAVAASFNSFIQGI